MPQAGFPRSGGVEQLAKLSESIISHHFANWIERSRLSRLASASASFAAALRPTPVVSALTGPFPYFEVSSCPPHARNLS